MFCNDLKADLSGEMRRIADFLGISVSFRQSLLRRQVLMPCAELNVDMKSIAYAQVDFDSGDLGIDVTGVFAATFPPVG